MQIMSEVEVVQALDLSSCISAMSQALIATTTGDVVQPLRQIMWLPDRRGALAAMPAMVGSHLGIKVISYFPGNSGTSLDPHQGWVVLFDVMTGEPRAALDAGAITWIRTAAVSAVATKALARKDAQVVTIVGSGAQALWHARAMCLVDDVTEIRIWGRRPAQAQALALALDSELPVPVHAVEDLSRALRDARVVCTTTSSSEPLVNAQMIEPGTHVNAVGSSVATARELDGTALAAASLFVDRRESAVNEAGEIVLACAEGHITSEHILAELAEVLIGRHPGRTSEEEVTIFKSVGLALEDVAAASTALTLSQGSQERAAGL